MIPEKQLKEIRKELEECQNPFFFFHDDADGLCSFLLLYKFKGEGRGKIVKNRPCIDEDFIGFIPDDADKIFILDIAIVTQEFIDKVKKPVVWIDHHTPLPISGCKYFNPRKKNPEEYTPVSSICYEAVDQDLLLGGLGTIGDLATGIALLEKFFREYSPLAGKYRDLFDVSFKTRIGELLRILEFNLKGKKDEIRKSISIFMKTKDFMRFLNPKTAGEKYVYRKYEKVNEEYEALLKEALKHKKEDPFVFVFEECNFVLGADLAREIPYRIPGKRMYVICREKSGNMLCSLRTGQDINLVDFLNNALEQVEGHGGGHPFAVGCSVKKRDFDRFLELVREA